MKHNYFIGGVILLVLVGVVFFVVGRLEKHSPDDGHDHNVAEKHSPDDGHDHAVEKSNVESGHQHVSGEKHSPDDGHLHPEKEHAVEDGHDHAAEKAEEPPVHLTEAQRAMIRIQLGTAVAGELDNVLRLNGEFRLDQDKTSRIMPRMPGFVTAAPVKEGECVKKGELLARLTSHKLGEYYSDYNSALEREKLTQAEFKMAERLRSSNAMAEQEYLRYKREYADAMIARSRAEALLKSLLIDPAHRDHPHEPEAAGSICTEYEIRAPFDGTVIAKNISVGENFAEDNTQVVFVVSDLRQLWLDLRASSAELRQLKAGMSVTATPAGGRRSYSGKVVYVAPVIDENTRTGLVRVLMSNPDGELRSGEFAVGTIRLPSKERTVVVPREAVQLIGGETVVFVPQGDGFAPKVVAVGRSAKGMTQLLAGLEPGQKFVTEGAFELKSVLLTSGMDAHAGHGH